MALLDQVEQPAGRADDDVDALAQRVDLRLVGPAAVDGDDPGAELLAGGGEVAGHLDGQLAGRRDHQRLRRGAALASGQFEPVEQRDAEAEGLAGAGSGLPDQVGAGERDRQRQLLDREGAHDADRGERRDDLRSTAKSANAGLSGRTGRARRASGSAAASRSGSGAAGPCVVLVDPRPQSPFGATPGGARSREDVRWPSCASTAAGAASRREAVNAEMTAAAP